MEDEQKDAIGRVVPNNASLPVLSRQQTETIVYKKPEKSLHFTCITIGTRGDVQPYIALCKGLMKEGHRCRIATHDEFKDWIEEHGIEFRTVGGDPGELMVSLARRICIMCWLLNRCDRGSVSKTTFSASISWWRVFVW